MPTEVSLQFAACAGAKAKLTKPATTTKQDFLKVGEEARERDMKDPLYAPKRLI
jgi:hypothetical protein